jgi:hypothetical protein
MHGFHRAWEEEDEPASSRAVQNDERKTFVSEASEAKRKEERKKGRK